MPGYVMKAYRDCADSCQFCEQVKMRPRTPTASGDHFEHVAQCADIYIVHFENQQNQKGRLVVIVDGLTGYV